MDTNPTKWLACAGVAVLLLCSNSILGACAPGTLLLGGSDALATGLPSAGAGLGAEGPRPNTPTRDRGATVLTGTWRGTYVNQNDVVSKAYLDIREHADGTLSGRWGNGPQGALVVERGERVTRGVYQWEASSPTDEAGRYRIRAACRGDTLRLDITYTWREDGAVRGLIAESRLTRE